MLVMMVKVHVVMVMVMMVFMDLWATAKVCAVPKS